ncbi:MULTISPECIES: hypothetical protein [unclassified Myroides]|uniref:hypothetical protein n=1 Tax=unclassified Myroides TaxID=2642485 RepID=UPI003100D133
MKVFGYLFIFIGIIAVFVTLNGMGEDMPQEVFVVISLLAIILGAYFLYKDKQKGDSL